MSEVSLMKAGGRRVATAAAAAAATLAVALAAIQVAFGAVAPGAAPFPVTLILALAFVSYAALGALVVWRADGHRIGWLLLLIGLLFLAGGATENAAKAIVDGGSPSGWVPAWLSWVDSWAWSAALGLAIAVILLFPTGRVPSRRWRPVGWAIAATVVVKILEPALRPGRLDGGAHLANPIGLSLTADILSAAKGLSGPVAVAAAIGSLVALFTRRRGAGEIERQQLRWVTVAVAFTATSAVLAPLGPVLHLPLVFLPFFSVVVILPASVAIAVLRYRLYDLDLVVNRVLVYSLLVLSVTVLYAGLVGGAGLLFSGRVRSNLAATALASAAVALAVIPLRDVLRAFVARIILGHRATPYQVLSEFADQMRAGWTLDAVLPQTASLLVAATGATLAVVYLRATDDFSPLGVGPPGVKAELVPRLRFVADGSVAPEPPGSLDLVVSVRQGDEILGAVGLRKDPGSPVTPADRRLVEQLASHAALLFENLRLTAALEHRLAMIADQARDLADSRRRLVTAQDDERRRIERNIHDGAQQDLVALMAKVRLAQNAVARTGVVSEGALAELQDDLRRALGELRQLAHGIYPPLLADRGLVAAVEARTARFPIPVDVEVDPGARGARLARAAEGALYFVTSEALANVLKHADASSVCVRLRTGNDEACVEIADDGCGLGTSSWGSGLTGMSDRVAALGGRFSVSSSPAGGTLVAASVPADGWSPCET